MLENFGQCFQWQHVEMKEIASLLINGFLQPLLCGRLGGQIANSSGGNIILCKRINQSFADLGGVRDLNGRWRPPWIPVPEFSD